MDIFSEVHFQQQEQLKEKDPLLFPAFIFFKSQFVLFLPEEHIGKIANY